MNISVTVRLLSGFAMIASTALTSVEAISSLDRDRDDVRRLGLASRKLEEYGKFGKFDKALKHTKDWKKGKFEKGSKYEKIYRSEKGSKSEKQSKKGKGGGYDYSDDDSFSDDFWEGQCIFNYFGFGTTDDATDSFPDRGSAAQCIETFAESTHIDIDIENALDCSESIEKVVWQSYPSCFELMYYTPYFCADLFLELDEAFKCLYDLIWEPPCYLDYMPESFDGCAINFAKSVGLDVEEVTDCTIDLYDELDDMCYNHDENSSEACETFDQCESVILGADNCFYDTGVDLADVASILEQELGVANFTETIYDGSVDLGEVLVVLEEYNGLTGTNESEWSEFVECLNWEFHWLIDDFCYWENERTIIEGCVKHFADSFEDLNVEDLLTCEMDLEEQFVEKCEFDETNQDLCETLNQCGTVMYGIDDCVDSIFGSGFSGFAEMIVETDYSFGDVLPSLYNGTIDLPSVFQRLANYDGPMSEDSRWEDFVVCISEFDTWE